MGLVLAILCSQICLLSESSITFGYCFENAWKIQAETNFELEVVLIMLVSVRDGSLATIWVNWSWWRCQPNHWHKADTLSVELESKAHCLLNWSLCDICSCPPASAQRKDMRIKLSSQKSKTLNSSFLNLWKNSESTDKYFQTETTGLFWERWPQRFASREWTQAWKRTISH